MMTKTFYLVTQRCYAPLIPPPDVTVKLMMPNREFAISPGEAKNQLKIDKDTGKDEI